MKIAVSIIIALTLVACTHTKTGYEAYHEKFDKPTMIFLSEDGWVIKAPEDVLARPR